MAMAGHDEAPRVRRGLREKREAVLEGALRVFARDGYTRGSIGDIAHEAGVSTRTIYNHFTDKDELFREVITASAARVREAQLAKIERHFAKVTDVEADLRAFVREFAVSGHGFRDHFALVRQINAEVGHLPPEVIDAWRRTGPEPVKAAIAEALAGLAERGLLEIDDPSAAAAHLMALTGAEVSMRTFMGALPIEDEEVHEIVDSGLGVFLRAYRPR